MLREVFDDLKGKNKVLSMKEFKAWEDIEEMLETGMITSKDIDTLAKKVGFEKSFSFDQFKALVELLDEVSLVGAAYWQYNHLYAIYLDIYCHRYLLLYYLNPYTPLTSSLLSLSLFPPKPIPLPS
jgi:hypothetical protein